MVRLVFRPYIQVRRTICTSVSLRASTRVSPGFALLRHSSPSFGSQHMCSSSNYVPKFVVGSWYRNPNHRVHFTRSLKHHLLAHMYGLLGPCFKTGRLDCCRPTTQALVTTRAHPIKASSSDEGADSHRHTTQEQPAHAQSNPSHAHLAHRLPKKPNAPLFHAAWVLVGFSRE